MKNIIDVISKLSDSDVFVFVQDGKLKTRSDANALTPEIIALIKDNKQELLAYLSASALSGQAQPETILPRNRKESRLSFAQQRLWLLDQIDGGSAHYNMPGALRLSGSLNREALNRAIGSLLERHESLRTCFRTGADGQPLQVIQEAAPYALPMTDLSHLASGEQQMQLALLIAEEAKRTFDLSRDLMLRASLLKLAEDEHVLLVTTHHIASDGWSMAILVNEFSALYSAYAQGHENPLPPPAIQYADYAHWQREWLQGEALDQQLGYWSNQLAGLPIVHGLPLDYPRPQVQTFNGCTYRTRIDAPTGNALNALCQASGATLFMGLHAAFSVLLSRYSNETDIVVGSPIANREQAEVANLIGFFVNTLVLRSDLSMNPSFADLLEQSRRTLTDAYAHQQVPFEKIVEKLQPVRSSSHSPLFQILLVLQNNEEGVLQLPGLHLSPIAPSGNIAKYDLTLHVAESRQGLLLDWEYNTDLFEHTTIARMAMHFEQLLMALLRAPQENVFKVDMLNEAERRQQLVEWNATAASYPKDRCIHQLFEEQAAKNPDAIALAFEEQTLTYAELNRRANQLAHYLIAEKQVQPDTLVGLCVERSFDMVIGILGILKAGGAYVPLDPAYPTERLAYMLSDSAPAALVTQSALADDLPAHGVPLIVLDGSHERAALDRQPDTNPVLEHLSSRHLAYVIYTSGSTGQPKGVMIEHGHVSRLFAATDHWFGFDATDVWTLFHSFAFDFSVWEMWGALAYGGRLVIVPALCARAPQEFYALLCRHGVTVLNQTPSAFRPLISAQAESNETHSLRHVIFGGEALELPTLAPWIARNDPERTRLINMYGITEITVHATFRIISADDVFASRGSMIGEPIPDLQIYILNAQRQPVPLGVAGEIYVGGAGVARGYLNRPELTAERFIHDPFGSNIEARLYKTGDLGRRLPNGDLEYMGRNDFQVKIRGFRIELGEIEARLLACAGVREAAVVAREDQPGDKRLVAYVVAKDGAQPSAAQLRSELAQALAEYMVPSAFVMLDALPLTTNGKLDRKALPAPDLSQQQAEYVAPRTDVESRLCDVWQDVLGVPRVGVTDNFFQLGGHSLLVMQVIARLQQHGITMTARQLFNNPTLADLASALQSESDASVPVFKAPDNRIPDGCMHITPDMLPLISLSAEEIERIVAKVPGGAANVQDIYPLGPLQEGILFQHMVSSQGDPYVTPCLFGIGNRQAVDDILSSMQRVIDRHDVLRTAVLWDGLSVPVQVVCRRANLPVSWLTLNPDQDAMLQMQALCAPEKQWMDLGQAPLLRIQIAADPHSERHFLLLQNHHIISDHVGLEIIQKELAAFQAGRGDALPESIGYREFVAHALHQAKHNDAEAFFRKMLGDIDEPTAPYNLLDVRRDGSRITETRARVPAEIANRVRRIAKEMKVSPAVLFHAAWAMVIAGCSGRDDVVFGTVLSGRLQGTAGAENMLGVLINTLPLRVKLAGLSAAGLVKQVQTALQDLVPYEQSSLGLAQRCSGLPNGTALFSALLNYRHSVLAKGNAVLGETEVEIISIQERTNYPFNLSIDDLGSAFELDLQVDRAVNAERVAGYVQTALAELTNALSSTPELSIQKLSILPAAERRQQLVEWNATAASYPNDRCIHQLFEEQAAKNPDAIALAFEEQTLTYAELNRRANQLAHYLIAEKQVQPDTLVGLCVERSFDMVIGILGILKAGGAYVPLDPAYPTERLAYMLSDSAPAALVTQSALADDLPAHGVPLIVLDGSHERAALDRQPDTNPVPAHLSSRHLAYVIYTSGSTGQPKGVRGEHLSIVNRLLWMEKFVHPVSDDIFCLKTSIAFVDHVAEVFQPLICGCASVIISQEDVSDPLRLTNILIAKKVSRITLVPSLLWALLEEDACRKIASLRYVISSGEPLTLRIVKAFHKKLPGANLINLYGSTEIGADASYYEIGSLYENSEVMRYFVDELKPGDNPFMFRQKISRADDDNQSGKANLTLKEVADCFQDTTIPDQPIDLNDYIDTVNEQIIPNLIDVSSDRFIGHMTSKLPSFVPDISQLIARLNQNVVKIETSKGMTFIERQVLSSMHRLFYNLDEDFYEKNCQDPRHVFGVVVSGGSVANVTALWYARNQAILSRGLEKNYLIKHGFDRSINELGYKKGVILGTRLLHYSIKKAISVFGIGQDSFIEVKQDDAQKMSIADLERCIDECHKNGYLILAVIGIAGATETGTVDPLDKIAAITRKHRIHFHVDAAWGGAFQFSERYKYKLVGIEHADSITICPHKQLFLPQGISLCLFKDTFGIRAISTHAEYQAKEGSYDLGQYTLEGSRPANALFLHASLYLISKKGYAWLIDQSMEKVRYFVKAIEQSNCFELVGSDPDLNIVNYRYIPFALRGKKELTYTEDETAAINQAVELIQQHQFEQGRTFVSKTKILVASCSDLPLSVFRVVLSNPLTSMESLREVLNDQLRIAQEYVESGHTKPVNHLPEPEIDAGKYDYDNWLVPIGKPISNSQIYVLDASRNLVPCGVVGEIYVGGDCLARNYLNKPEQTNEKFVPNPFSTQPGARLYRTGDLARWTPDGILEYAGRVDHQVKIRGFRIELGEIENTLFTCESVKDAVVVARNTATGDKRLVAYVVRHSGDTTDTPAFMDSLRLHLSRTLPDYMVPAAFVMLDTLPLNPNGKVDRKALPDPDMAEMQADYVAPRNPLEDALAKAWGTVLNLDKVGIYDNFFKLGGHSLLAVQLVSRLRQAHGMEVSLRDLFAHPTIADLAGAVAGTGQTNDEPVYEPILPAARDHAGPLPLSWMQQRLWFLDRLDAGAGAAYHMPGGLRLLGRLDRSALHAALDRIVARHEILRTCFANTNGELIQIIGPADTGFALEEQNLSALPVTERNAAMQSLIASEAARPFNLETGPLIRGLLLRLDEDEHVLLVVQHHIISDGWSLGILNREVSTLYVAFSQGLPDPLPPLPVQYADYALWQRRWLQGAVLQGQIDFWRSHLEGAPTLLELPTDRPRPAVQSYAGSMLPLQLSPELSASLRKLSQQHGVTLFMTLLAAWSMLMARLSGQRDVVIGTPVANRQRTEVEPLIGFFVNTLALRVQLDDAHDVAQLLAHVKETTLAAYAHQDLPFDQVVEALQPTRTLAHSPIFQTMLSLNNTPTGGIMTLPGLTLSPLEIPHSTTHFDVSLSLTDNDERIQGRLEYASDLFDTDTMTRMAGYFETLLTAMTADPSQTVSRLPMLSPQQRDQLLHGFNDTAVAYPSNRLIHQLFEDHAARNPDAAAVVYEEQTLTYGELNRRANQLAYHLLTFGVQPDDRVAICVERSLEMVIGILGILKAGAAYVPLDPNYPDERLAHMLADSAPLALLTQSMLANKLPAQGVPMIMLDKIYGSAMINRQPTTNLYIPGLTARHLAYVIYTSGSTGTAKGVMIEHRSAVNFCKVLENTTHYYCPKPGRVALNASYSFDMSLKGILQLLSGHCLVIIPQLVRASGVALLDFLKKNRVDAFDCTPTQLDLLLSAGLIDDDPDSYQPKSVLIGGEAINPAMWRKLRSARAIHFYNMYGPTEATIDATIGHVRDLGDRPNIGSTIPNARVYILDEHRQPVPLGAVGEIYIGGAGVARGYLNRPELTAERFLDDCFAPLPGGRMYKTGDLGRWMANGTIEYIGRNDFQVKIRGFRIELGEIEAALLSCACVREAAVMAREDIPGDKRLVAYVVLNEGMTSNAAELRSQLGEVLAEYMLPSAFVILQSMPHTPNGKLDRRALPAPDQASIAARQYEPPQGKFELALAGIWQDVLSLPQVGRHDHFFELGGHSLLIVSLIERLRQQELDVDMRTVFTTPVLSEMAAALKVRRKAGPSFAVPPNRIPSDCTTITPDMLPLVELNQAEIDLIVDGDAGNIQDIYPLSPLQEGILFHHLLNKDVDVYLQRVTMAFDSRKRLDAFLHALQAVIDRHDVLRSGFRWNSLSQAVQVVYRKASLPIRELTLSSGADPMQRMVQQVAADGHGVNLQTAPVMAAHIAADPDSEEWLLVLFHHHIAIDHITLDLIVNEIQALLHGRESSLTPSVPYRNFIAQLQTVSQEDHEAYFRRQLGDIEEPTTPFGIVDVHRDGVEIKEDRLVLDAELAKRIRDKARRHGVSSAVLFHVAFAQVLAQCVGRDDVVFGTVLLGRLQGTEGADRAMGLFMNTLPIRVALAQGTLAEVVQNTYRRLHELLEHEQAPLALAQRCSGVTPPLPLFSALLNYRHANPEEQSAGNHWEGMRLIQFEERTNYPLTLSVDDLETGFSLTAQCVPGIPARRINTYVATAMTGLLDALDGDIAAGHVSILPPDERRQVLYEFNDTAAAYPTDRLIHQLFEDQAARNPDAAAVAYEEQTLTYGELNRRANQLAHYLLSLGVQPDDRVAICIERNLDMVISLLGILKAGAAYVPLDPAYPAERLAYMLADSAPAALITHSTLQDVLPAQGVPLIALDSPVSAAAIVSQQSGNPDVPLTPHHLAYVIYTSGSTGQPKGVMIEHGNASNFIFWANDSFTPQQLARTVFSTSINFDLAVFELFAPLSCGATIRLVGNIIAASGRLAGNTLINTVPSAVQALLDGGGLPDSIQSVNVAGEPLKQALAERLFDATGIRQLANLYGPTETTTYSTWAVMDREQRFVPHIGRPVANTQVYILDRHRQPVPLGATGEIYIGGAGVARGYLNRPELTAERFLPDPFGADPDARMYKTGDLARHLPDGNIVYLGRNDFQVKIRGFRIELGEIEAKLAACEGVREATVMAREDQPGDKRLVAYVVARPGATLSAAALRTTLNRTLAEYMVPSAFVMLDAFPLTPNGKLDRRALPAPDQAAVATRAYEAPQGEIETAIAQLWQDLLGLDRVGRHDHFFELGGHSLMAVRLIEKIRKKKLPFSVSLQQLMRNPTIAAIAGSVSTGSNADGNAIVTGKAPILPNNYWFFKRRDLNYWNSSMLLELTIPYEPHIIERAIAHLLEHHDGLRSVWLQEGKQWSQLFQEPSQMAPWWNIVDLSQLTDSEAQLEIESRCAEIQKTLDIKRVLFRAFYFDLGRNRPGRLMFAIHHLIIDGYSKAIFMSDLEQACADLAQGQAPAFPQKTTSIKEAAEFIHQLARTLDAKAELEYWCSRPWDRYRALPKGTPSEAVAADTGIAQPGVVFDGLSAEYTRRLEAIPGHLPNVTVEHVLITAIVIAYGKWSGAKALCLNTVHHGRLWQENQKIDLSRTIGWLANYSNCMHDITDCKTLLDAVQTVARQRDERKGKEAAFTLLKYMHPDESVRTAMAALPEHQLEFNFIPRQATAYEKDAAEIDGGKDGTAPAGFKPAKENSGSDEGPMHSGFAPFSKAYFSEEGLKFYWVYCKTAHSDKTFTSFAAENRRAIENIIDGLESEFDLQK